VDVEANYFIVKGFAKTSFLSAMLINAFSTPGVVILSFVFLNTSYQWSHYFGVLLALIGLFLLIVTDILTDKGYDGENPVLGDLYCIAGALLYSVSNVTEEFFVRKHSKWEILGFLGFFGSTINGFQLFILERQELASISFSLQIVELYTGFTLAFFSLYALVPYLIGTTSATFYNISLLTSDFYGLILGFFVFKAKAHPLYPIAFGLIIIGLLVYNLFSIRLDSDDYAKDVASESNSLLSEESILLPSSSLTQQYGISNELSS